MKTQIYSLPDWQEILREIGWSDAPNQDDVEKEILRELTRGKVTFVEVSPEIPIEKACRVTLKTQSVLPKFNKEQTVVTVGNGLYDPTVESLLCGMVVGDHGETEVKGEKVAFTVLKVEQKQFPVLSDTLVQELQLEGIQDLPTYRRFMNQKIKSEYAAGLVRQVVDRLLLAAKMDDVAQEDICSVIDLEYEPLRVRFSLDALSPEKWKKEFGKVELRDFYAQIYPDVANLFGTTGKESYYESRKEAATETIRTCLVLGSILGSVIDPTEDPKAEQILKQAMTQRVLHMIYGG